MEGLYAGADGLQKRFVFRHDAIADRRKGGLGDRIVFLDHNTHVVDSVCLSESMEGIFLASGTGIVIAQEYALRAIPPAHERGECAFGIRAGLSRHRGQFLGETLHHEQQRVERVDAIRAKKGFRPKCRPIAKFRLVKCRLSVAPAGAAGALTHRFHGLEKSAVESAHGNQTAAGRGGRQLNRILVRGSNGLFDEQMFAGLKSDHPVFVVQLRTSKNVDGVYVGALQGGQSVAAALEKAKLMPGCECALWVYIAHNGQYDLALVAQTRERR